MSRLSLKNDFKDGEILYGAQINTNNDATVAAVNDNYEEILKLKDIKADVVNVDNQLKTKVDVGTFNDAINSLNDSKADKSVVNQKADKTELANKADLIYVNNEFSKKADINYVNTQLTQKANLSDVNSKLSLKADKATTYTKDEINTTIDNKIVSKADKTELNSKADKSSLGDLSQLLTSDKSSAVAAINETIREGVANNIDALSITKSNDNKIQTVGVIDSNAKGYATKTWTGTRNEYNSIQNKNANTLYYIIDDDDEHELVANKVKTIDENSNDTQYPSAKAVYDRIKESAPDLSNYVQYDNYAVSNKGGVIKGNLNGFNVDSSGTPLANVYNKENYDSANESIFISKGTLENIKDDYVGTSEPINVLNDTLDNVIPKQTATDSIINVNDALKYKTFNFKVDGAYKQTTYTGKNLANVRSLYCPVLTGSLENQEATINGTNDQNTNVTLNFQSEGISLKANQSYMISVICSGTVTGTGYKKLYMQVQEKSSVDLGNFASNNNTTYTYTPETDVLVKTINMDIALNQTFNNFKVKVQIEKGSTATDYEPYVGGVAVPNPNQPSEITTLNFDKIMTSGQNKPYQATDYSIDLQGNEMVSLPNGIKDELQIDKEGNVNLIKKVGKILLNSVEKWNLIGDTETYWEYVNYNLSDSAKYSYCLSNYFSSDEDNRLIYTLTEIYCRFPKSLGIDVSDTEKFKQWLSSNNVYGYYEKTTPQTISLGKLSDLITTEQGSNTFAINGNIDTNISTTYALDLKKYIDNKISTVSQAVLEQE